MAAARGILETLLLSANTRPAPVAGYLIILTKGGVVAALVIANIIAVGVHI